MALTGLTVITRGFLYTCHVESVEKILFFDVPKAYWVEWGFFFGTFVFFFF